MFIDRTYIHIVFESLEDDLIDVFCLAYTYKIATRRYFLFIILDELGRW